MNWCRMKALFWHHHYFGTLPCISLSHDLRLVMFLSQPDESCHPEIVNIDGNNFFTALVQQAIALCSVAERQQGQDPQPDARLAVAHCLQAACSRLCSGLPFEPAPPQCISLVEVASRVMASFAARPEAASAASMLLPPISHFLSGPLSDSAQKCGLKLNKARRSLLASVELLLEGPQLLLSAACAAARGPVLVGEAAALVFHAVTIALWASGYATTAGESRLAARLLQQCVVLLSDQRLSWRSSTATPFAPWKQCRSPQHT